MPPRALICLFDLRAYDERAAPALRAYAHDFNPGGVVGLLRELARSAGSGSASEDYQHWIDSIGPDAGYKPSDQTMTEICGMVIPGICLPKLPGIDPAQEIGKIGPWLAERSEWFADLMDGGEELAGGRLEFSFGSGSLVSTKEQIAQFRGELEGISPPEGPWSGLGGDFSNLRKLVEKASMVAEYALLRTDL